ncbi:2,3-diaminopropionate biosynthesis protein SbnA [Desulfobacterales bacterium HSG2]|nr:2,3-diaminopropionate biosynthesis protein SbnA [Desulfobacterales bacterium HSG2]
MISNRGILKTIGNTPLVKLERVLKDFPIHLFVKLEMFNPGGSIKDRTALIMLQQAIERGDVREGTTIIESSSGNLAIGLAQACRFLNLRLICVVDPKTTQQNINIMKAYRAEVDMVTDPDPVSGEYLDARINRVKSLTQSISNAFWTNQYANPDNPKAHYTTMKEILNELNGVAPDYFFCAVSTCGTLRGCSEYIRKNNLKTEIMSVDAVGSIIYSDIKSKRLIPGHGAARVPELFRKGLEDEYIHVSDLECISGCRRLLKSEAILAGGSSGGVISAIEKKAPEIRDNAVCVAIIPDSGERYLDTIYSDEWVTDHFGDVFHLWEDSDH